ncbi:MAG: RNA-binding protein [Proteobacteria bacterium]|nr:RNA-binding protein [Pseudomonadota bacterium]
MAPRKNDPSRRHGADDSPDAPGGTGGSGGSLRVDKWLWCTRFFKTRGLAQEAVDGGHVQIGGDRVKASRMLKPGDRLQVTREREQYIVDVVSIPVRRGPAAEARQHYRETPESEAGRVRLRELNRLAGPVSSGRPDKRERRDLMRIVKGRGGLTDGDLP